MAPSCELVEPYGLDYPHIPVLVDLPPRLLPFHSYSTLLPSLYIYLGGAPIGS